MTEPTKKLPFNLNKKKVLLISGFVIGILLLVLSSGFSSNNQNTNNLTNDAGSSYSDILEVKLEEFLKKTEGIFEADVFVTVDGGSENEYVKKGNGYSEDYLIIKNNGSEEAAIAREVYPKVRGVAVICTGGEDPTVQEKVTMLLSAALGISTSKIKVAGIN